MATLLHLNEKALLIINVYMPSMHQKSEIRGRWGELESYVADLMLQNPNAMVVMGGDLNARLGPNDQTLYTRFGHTHQFWRPEAHLQLEPQKTKC